ncbi:MAG TPA: hypothetical protein VFZ66_05790 [Herpetosiphonaceae bacterium]
MTPFAPTTEEHVEIAPRARWSTPRLLWAGLVVGICLIAGIAATWPLALYLPQAMPMGTEREATVPLFNLWTLWWNADRLLHGFARYWDAPIFYPNPGTFTFSEPQPLTGLLAAPLWYLGAPLALIYNLALLTLLTLNGVFAYRLARALEIPAPAALLAGALTVTLPFVAKIAGVLQLTALFGMLWTIEGLVRFGRAGTTRWAIWAALGFVATYLTCQQYALMFTPFAAAGGLVALAQQRFQQGALLRLIPAGVGAALLVLLIAFPALNLQRELGLSRPETVVQALSARPADFLTRPDNALVPIPPISMEDTAGLFPGLILTVLAAAGIVRGVRDAQQRRWTIFLAASTAAALLLALGLNLSLAGWQPFATLRALVPGFSSLRSPFRFAAIMQLFLPILAALALTNLRSVGARGGLALLLGAGLLGAVENLSSQGGLVPMPPNAQNGWTAWLRDQPDTTVVAHIPFPAGLHVAAYESETWRMLGQMEHHKPIVNGYSGYFPQIKGPNGEIVPVYTQFQSMMAERFPDYVGLCTLNKGLGVNTLVVDRQWLAQHSAQMAEHSAFLQPAYDDDQVQIYRLAAPEGECQARQQP